MLNSNQIRNSFIEFFKNKGHQFVASSPVVPVGDETLLFANAGMNQFKDIFLGIGSRPYKRAVNSQKCIRAGGKHNDLEDVGTDTYHHTFFEMLGNWSFGDYFKTEAIDWAWELLTKVWKLDPERLHTTYFEGDSSDGLDCDSEALQLWMKYLPQERIHKGGKKDNFWEMGQSGPCGPCSEIHYDGTADKSGTKKVNTDDPDVIEIWNLVFIQYNRDTGGKLSPLPAKHVDTGMGLERITRILQGKNSNYDTDIFKTIITEIEKITGRKYSGKPDDRSDIAFRVVADHLRTLVFAITDGGIPGNEGRGYVLRRILRRAARFGTELGMSKPFIYRLTDVVVETMGQAFSELNERADLVKTVIKSEEESFSRTLDRGIDIFRIAAEKAQKNNSKTISGKNAFELYDTYGFPLDLTQLMARESGLKVDNDMFDELMAAQRQRARAAQKSNSIASLATDTVLPKTNDSQKYESLSCRTVVLGWVGSNGYNDQDGLAEQSSDAAIVLKDTCFYAESGGQVGDCGRIEGPTGRFIVETTEKIAECVMHRGKMESGTIKPGQKVRAVVDGNRLASTKNHTATHLLQWALRQVLGDSVKQQGSLVCPEYLRFDFTAPSALSTEQITETEKLVNGKIEEDIEVSSVVMPIAKAQKIGAMALFGEKYGEFVRVISVGSNRNDGFDTAFSKEFCGGTHVKNTGDIGGFKIIKEESVSAGIRRITALTGKGLREYLTKRSDTIDRLCRLLKVPHEQIAERVKKILDDNKKLTKELKAGIKKGGGDCMAEAKELLKNSKKIGTASIVIGTVRGSIEQIRGAMDMVKKKAASAAIVFGVAEHDKVMLFAGVTDDLIKNGLSAGDIVKEIAPIVGGGGGGRPRMAQAGGKNPEKLNNALEKAAGFIKEKLG